MNLSSKNQFVLSKSGCSLYLKREDLLHDTVSGNKFRKLKYNLAYAKEHAYKSLLTFGGAFSNHIAATAAAGKIYGFHTIGIIRGEELAKDLKQTLIDNATLSFAKSCGMELHFISREAYRAKGDTEYHTSLNKQFNNPYIIPEGGTNDLAIKGCEEILTTEDEAFDYICCPVGTAGTISGVINSLLPHQEALGFPALKGKWMMDEVARYAQNDQWKLIGNYNFGGYAKIDSALVQFINSFKDAYNIQLDPIYTGKMLYGICDLIDGGYFSENSRILALHTGGLQGIAGINKQLDRKKLPLIR